MTMKERRFMKIFWIVLLLFVVIFAALLLLMRPHTPPHKDERGQVNVFPAFNTEKF